MDLLAVCLAALLFGFVGSMPLAGPIAVIVVSRAAHEKFAEARRIGLGAAVAEGIYAGVAFWGFAALLSAHTILVPISHATSALVLVTLGVRFVFFPSVDKKESRETKAGTWLFGFSVSAVNPTLLVTWTAAVAFLYSKWPRVTPAFYAVPFGACAAIGVGGWFVLLHNVLRRYEGRLPRAGLTWLVRGLGLALVGLGVWSAVQLVGWLTRHEWASRPGGPHAVLSLSPGPDGTLPQWTDGARLFRCSSIARTTTRSPWPSPGPRPLFG